MLSSIKKIISQNSSKNIFVTFRFDDFSSLSNFEMDKKIIQLFEAKNIPLTVGVIPYNVNKSSGEQANPDEPFSDLEKIDMLKTGIEKKTLNIALHGYSHTNIGKSSSTEFECEPFEVQKAKITKGEVYLSETFSIPVTIFFPPWQSYDVTTLSALEDCGFQTISAHKNGVTDPNSKLQYIPVTCSINELEKAVKSAEYIGQRNPLIVVLFHAYDFIEEDPKRGCFRIHEFEQIIDNLLHNKLITFLSFEQLTQIGIDFSASRYIHSQNPTFAYHLLRKTFAEVFHSQYIYPEIHFSLKFWMGFYFYYSLFFIIGFFIACIFSQVLLANKINNSYSMILFFSIFLLIVSFMLARKSIHRRGLIFLSIFGGSVIGSLVNYFKIGS